MSLIKVVNTSIYLPIANVISGLVLVISNIELPKTIVYLSD